MARLYKIAGLVFAAACILAGSTTPVVAQDYCSLKVRVVMPAKGRVEVPVVVKERNGRTIEREQDLDSEDVLFCDLGILSVTVIVGQKGCNQITVEDVPLSWQKMYSLVVNYDYGPCMEEAAPSPTPYCEILLRVKSPDGKWVKQARVKFDDPTFRERETDSAGRSLLSLKLHGNVQGNVSARGFAPRNFSVGCPDLVNREEILTLAQGSEAGSTSKGNSEEKPKEPRPVRQPAEKNNQPLGESREMRPDG